MRKSLGKSESGPQFANDRPGEWPPRLALFSLPLQPTFRWNLRRAPVACVRDALLHAEKDKRIAELEAALESRASQSRPRPSPLCVRDRCVRVRST